jgi:hypothetical protein
MALGYDSQVRGAPAAPIAKQPGPTTQQKGFMGYGQAPGDIGDRYVNAQTNNQRASSAGQGQVAMQNMDRGGMSRGRGQQSRAETAQALGDVQGNQQAMQTEMGAANANARNQLAYQTAMRGEQLGNEGLLEGLRNRQAMERQANQGWNQDAYEAQRKGQFGLDGIQLDYSGMLNGLLS